jgi:hypothetical protein
MSWLSKLRNALNRRQLDENLTDEIYDHVERRVAHLRRSAPCMSRFVSLLSSHPGPSMTIILARHSTCPGSLLPASRILHSSPASKNIHSCPIFESPFDRRQSSKM